MQQQDLKNQVEQEAAGLTLKLYNIKQEEKAIEERLKELSIMSQTLGKIEPKKTEGKFVEDPGTGPG